MRRLNQFQVYQLSKYLGAISNIASDATLQQHVWDIYLAKEWLRWLIDGTLGFQINVSRAAAEQLVGYLNVLVPDQAAAAAPVPTISQDRKVQWWEASGLSRSLTEFETVFAAELPTIATYVVAKKGIYETADLIERSEQAIDEGARAVLSEDCKSDFQQAGKCLAFELPTASGFHTMRATESVVRKYWQLVKKPVAPTKPPEMAVCINELRAAGEDPKLMDVLDHIRDLHRNTLMHPEAFLTMAQALRLFDIAKSAISAMGDRITELQQASSSVSATGLTPLGGAAAAPATVSP